MSDLTEDVQLTFERFREQCAWLQKVYNVYDAFDPAKHTGKRAMKVEEIYRKTAPIFFEVTFTVLCEYLFLQVARVSDPPENNLCVPFFDKRLETLGLSSDEIRRLSENILSFAKPIRVARNKLISHADKRSIMSGTRMGAHEDKGAWKKFLVDLQQYCDAVGRAVGAGPSDVSCLGLGEGDSIDLLRHLRAGMALQSDCPLYSDSFYSWVEGQRLSEALFNQFLQIKTENSPFSSKESD